MAKINQKEYDILKGLDDKWEWIARDGGVFERVCVYSKPPKKGGVCWGTASPIDEWESLSMSNSFFQSIKWEDEEPYNIQELIKEYEQHEKIEAVAKWAKQTGERLSNDLRQFGQAISKAMTESEETEVKKNIEWLKEKVQNRIDKLPRTYSGLYIDGSRDAYHLALKDINQLDEPEVLSQEWIEENSYDRWMLEGTMDDEDETFVSSYDLQNLLVPKQETSEQTDTNVGLLKPTIPQFVADWIDVAKSRHHTLLQAVDEYAPTDIKEWIWKYYNSDLFGKAWLAYPNIEVEKQPQYRLKAGDSYLYFNLDGTVRGATKDNATITNERLEQLPFDVEKAVESGIIEVEELEE